MSRRSVCLVALVMLLCSQVFASPVNLPDGLKGNEGLFIKEKIAGVADISGSFLFDGFSRKIKSSEEDGKASANFFGGQIDLTLSDKVDLYVLLGGLSSPELEGNDLGSDWKVDFEDQFMWGIGLSAIIYELKDSGIQIFGDVNYREAKDIDAETLTVDGTQYTKEQLSVGAKADWDEWQIALGISKKFEYFIPYVGVKYSDIKTTGEVTYSGDTYGGSAKSKGKVGPFIGVSILPMKGVSIDLCGRFVDETAFSAKATIRF